jgi:hypothetical protein
MTEKDALERWIELHESRGIAGIGARETAEEKLIVERSVVHEFADTARKLLSVEISDIRHEEPPLPDFSTSVLGQTLRVELTELIDSKLVKKAKHIKKTPDDPLNNTSVTGGLWFETSRDWFSDLLLRNIEKKERIYQCRETKIDVLLVWNEALQVGIEDTERWLREFEFPELASVSSVYLQSWNHPSYAARPTWSVKAHPLIGEIKPVLTDL